jgi:hypothetical protein
MEFVQNRIGNRRQLKFSRWLLDFILITDRKTKLNDLSTKLQGVNKTTLKQLALFILSKEERSYGRLNYETSANPIPSV